MSYTKFSLITQTKKSYYFDFLLNRLFILDRRPLRRAASLKKSFFAPWSRTCNIFLTSTVLTFPSVLYSVVYTSTKAPYLSRFLTCRALQSKGFMFTILSAEDCCFCENWGKTKYSWFSRDVIKIKN